VKEDEKKK
jgi:hypothetical protein